MSPLRNRLAAIFLVATALPLGVTLWVADSLLDRALRYSAAVDELQQARQTYQRERAELVDQVASGALRPEVFAPGIDWPQDVRDFADSSESERLALGGIQGDTLCLLRRDGDRVLRYSRQLGGVQLDSVRRQYAEARRGLADTDTAGLRRAFLLLAVLPWLVSLGIVVYAVRRATGVAMEAYNRMAGELQRSREKLVYVTRLESWQALARKTAHEVKNSLTPIRLMMEELAARHPGETFERQAAQIIVDEVTGLERRVRAFSELAAEPPVRLRELDARALLEERVSFLRSAHPDVGYEVGGDGARAVADEDLLRAVLTNLLENAAQAAGPGGRVLARTESGGGTLAIEVHDSGPGLSDQARATLFEPTISFKKGGMGLGLSIARKSAVLCGGDIELVKGALGGAGFRVLLPTECPAS
jgi:signal transduction histidine kinase